MYQKELKEKYCKWKATESRALLLQNLYIANEKQCLAPTIGKPPIWMTPKKNLQENFITPPFYDFWNISTPIPIN